MLKAVAALKAASIAVRPSTGPAELCELLLAGMWRSYCSQVGLDQIIEAKCMNPVLGVIEDYEPHLVDRAAAIAHTEDAINRWHTGVAGAARSITAAAALWADVDLPDALPNGELDESSAEACLQTLCQAFPDLAWVPITRLLPEAVVGASVRVPIALSTGAIGTLVLEQFQCGDRIELWPDPTTTAFIEPHPDLVRQLDMAWHWTVNQDRFAGGSCFWKVIGEDAQPQRTVANIPLGAAAAVGLGHLFRLARGTRAGPRQDTVVVARLRPSGLLERLPENQMPALLTNWKRPRAVVGPGQRWNGTRLSIKESATAGQAIRLLRKRPYPQVLAAFLLVVLLGAGLLTWVGNDNKEAAERAERAAFAQTLITRSAQSSRPDEALRLALAAHAVDPSGAAAEQGLVRAVNQDHRLAQVVAVPHTPPTALALGEKLLAIGAEDGAITLHDLERRSSSTLDEQVVGRVRVIAVSPDSRWLAAASSQNVVLVDLNTHSTAWRSEGAVRALAYSPDSSRLVVGSEDGTVRIRNLAEETERLVPGDGAVRAVAVTSSGTVVVGGEAKTVRVVDSSIDPPKILWRTEEKSAVTSLVLDQKANHFTYIEYSGVVHRHSLATFAPLREPLSTSVDSRLVAAPEGGEPMLAYPGGLADIDLASQSEATALSFRERFPMSGPLDGSAAVGPHRNGIVTLSGPDSILLWRPEFRSDLRDVRGVTGGHAVPGTDLVLIANGGGALHRYSEILLLQRGTGVVVDRLKLDKQMEGSLRSPIEFDPATATAAVRLAEGSAFTLAVRDRKLKRLGEFGAKYSSDRITALAFDPAHHRLLLARGEQLKSAEINELERPTERAIYYYSGNLSAILPARDGRELVLAGVDGVISLPLDLGGLIRGNGEQMGRQYATHAVMTAEGAVVVASVSGRVTSYRRESDVWVGTRQPGHRGIVAGVVVVDGLVVSAGQSRITISDINTGQVIVESRVHLDRTPTALWFDGQAVVVSSEFSYTSMSIPLAASDVLKKACVLGNWDRARLKVREVVNSAPAATAELEMCNGVG